MHRYPLPAHPLETSRLLLNLVSAGALAVVVGAVVLSGYPAGGITLLLILVAIGAWGMLHRKESLRALEVQRAEAVLAHAELLERREQYARDRGFGYEDTCADAAIGFGRIEQHIPEDPAEWEGGATMGERVKEFPHLERLVGLARHAGGLVAEGVVRMSREGFPVTVFDLELVHHDDLDGLVRSLKPAVALEVSKDYVTVWSVELPLSLPYVSSAYAWDGRRDAVEAFVEGEDRIERRAEHREFADLLLSVPAVREDALSDTAHPWFVDGARLIACARGNEGVDAAAVEATAARLARLAARLPWAELERFAVTDPQDRQVRATRIRWTHRWYGLPGQAPSARALWEERQITHAGLRAFMPADEEL
ncbi:hypothetical protein [Streptomyces sp. NBC_00091]|uniref:hypothetical protein n=1 Tax=Streptomyces sp. NBC_00091 TaxID=2975648 RepID=UPI00225B89AE|nr:hypothetical protein [Streptomyces sp. NBC_00091]MCX5379693.1 hypothetical protein [Streptomyces sp. NBC_00091]